MARNDGVDRTTVRNQPRTENNIADAEAHNERQRTCYRNEDIVPERSHMNIHFKTPSGSYQEMFRQMEQDGTISTRGLKQDAVHYGELIFDVNSAYFHNHGGYEFAQAFYAEAYRAAVDIVGGEQYILSAVMHADERNQGMSKTLGYDVWHYHLHVVYAPTTDQPFIGGIMALLKRTPEQSAAFERCVGFLAEMIEKYSGKVEFPVLPADSKTSWDSLSNPSSQTNSEEPLTNDMAA